MDLKPWKCNLYTIMGKDVIIWSSFNSSAATVHFPSMPLSPRLKMGSYFKKAIFDEHVQRGLLGWAQNVKKRKGGKAGNGLAKTNKSENESLGQVEMGSEDGQRAVSNLEEGRARVNKIKYIYDQIVEHIYIYSPMLLSS